MSLEAHRCENGHIFMPEHPVCPKCAGSVEESIDLTDRQAEVVTWTTATATPPGVREPNHLAIVEFSIDGESVRTIGQLTTGDISIGDIVEPEYVEELRDEEKGIRHPDSQEWDGYRFKPT